MAVHVFPLNDDRPHVLAASCWCQPDVQWLDPETGRPWANEAPMVVHNAADFRELAEGDGKSMAPGKVWMSRIA